MDPRVPELVLGRDAVRLYLWKPPGVPVFPPHADPDGDCVLRRFLAVEPGRAVGWPSGFEGGIAHRLDTATSGLLLVARTPQDLPPLRAAFHEHRLRKLYLFRSASPPRAPVVITEPLAHHARKRDRMVVGRGAHRGRWYPGWTRVRALGEGWWEAEIRTGVMHQVRAHAAWVGAPLDGDPIYAPAERRSLPFLLHHLRVVGPGWASPTAPLPAPWALPAGAPA